MTKNLDVVTYRNGDTIPQVTDIRKWQYLTTGAWCYYNNNSANGAIYGKLYNWYAVNDPRGLAPEGWHIPTNAEWTILINFLGGKTVAGGKMKTTGTTRWESPNKLATNKSGFAGLPGGYRVNYGLFSSIGYFGYWWSATQDISNYALNNYYLSYTTNEINNEGTFKECGLSVRCIKNDK
jgi:uncharacterized protein (TIGR02145 family)